MEVLHYPLDPATETKLFADEESRTPAWQSEMQILTKLTGNDKQFEVQTIKTKNLQTMMANCWA